MTFKLEDLLSVNYVTYCDIKEAKLSDYNVKGVHLACNVNVGYDSQISSAQRQFLESIPARAEAVVDFKMDLKRSSSSNYSLYTLSGLAVIPKHPSKDDENAISDNHINGG
jgi:hypothetical protein